MYPWSLGVRVVLLTEAFCSWRPLFKSKIQNLSNRFKEDKKVEVLNIT